MDPNTPSQLEKRKNTVYRHVYRCSPRSAVIEGIPRLICSSSMVITRQRPQLSWVPQT
jgi:hypothetical protein